MAIQEMLKMLYLHCKDLDEDSEEFVEKLHAWRATELKVRQVSRLASLCRLFESLERDETVEDVMRETRRRDDTDLHYEGDGYGFSP
jgi:hypothetical protein